MTIAGLILFAITALVLAGGIATVKVFHGAALVRRQAEQDEQAGQPR